MKSIALHSEINSIYQVLIIVRYLIYSLFSIRFDVARAPCLFMIHFLTSLEIQITNNACTCTAVKLALNEN